MKYTNIRYNIYLFLLICLSSCVSLKQSEEDSWHEYKTENINFSTDGRLSIKYNEQGYYTLFSWKKNNIKQSLSINTPLGNELGRLCQDENRVIASTAQDSKIYSADSLTELSKKLLGFKIPLDHLDLWISGYYHSKTPHSFDGKTLNQDGWKIKRFINKNQEPNRLLLQNEELKLNIVLDHFQNNLENNIPDTCEIIQEK